MRCIFYAIYIKLSEKVLYCSKIMVPEMKFYNVKGQEVRPPKNYGFRPAVYGMLIEEGKLLFIKPVWDDRYSLPGGAVELGEELTESLAREFLGGLTSWPLTL
jgi:hypothetical protein